MNVAVQQHSPGDIMSQLAYYHLRTIPGLFDIEDELFRYLLYPTYNISKLCARRCKYNFQ